MYGSLVEVYDLLNVRQSESEAFDIMTVTGMHTIEALKDLLQVLFLYSYTRIAYGHCHLAFFRVPRAQVDVQRGVWLTIFHGVVHEVEYDIAEVCLVNTYRGIYRLCLRVYLSACVLHSQRERVGYGVHEFVEVQFFHLEDILRLVEHGHLQHLFHEEAQSFCLIVDDSAEVIDHLLALGDGLIVEHL